MKKRASGFTLIEIMLVVGIIAILVSIAVPNYTSFLIKTRRNDAMATMQQFSDAMERYRLTNGNYTGANAAALPSAPLASIFGATAPLDGKPYYTLTIEDVTQTTFTLRATPIAGTSQVGDGLFELDSTGARRWNEDNDALPFEANEFDWVKG